MNSKEQEIKISRLVSELMTIYRMEPYEIYLAVNRELIRRGYDPQRPPSSS